MFCSGRSSVIHEGNSDYFAFYYELIETSQQLQQNQRHHNRQGSDGERIFDAKASAKVHQSLTIMAKSYDIRSWKTI